MKKIAVVLFVIFCCFGMIGYILNFNKNYYAITLHTFNVNSENGITNREKEIEKIGRIEDISIESQFVIISTFMPVSIEEEMKKNTNIEEMKKVTSYKKGEDAGRYSITLRENNKNILRDLKAKVVMIENIETVDENVVYIRAVITNKQLKNLKKEPWLEKISSYPGIILD